MGKEDQTLSKRREALALNEAEKFVQKRRAQIFTELVSRYRSGRTEHDWLLGMVAELSAGEYLLTEMQRSLTQEITNG